MIPQPIIDILNAFDPSRPPVVVTHRGCRDGTACAFLADLCWPGAKILLQAPQEEPLYLELIDRDVLVLDLHLTRPQLDAIKLGARSVVALDHHEDSRKVFEGLPWAFYDAERSGAGLALDAFLPDARQQISWHVARVILYVEAWDLWQHDRFPGVKEVCAYLDTLPPTPEGWRNLPTVLEMIDRGESLLRFLRHNVERIAEHATEIDWPDAPLRHPDGSIEVVKGGKLLAVNSPFCPGEIGEHLYDKRAPAPLRTVLIYYRTKRGDWKCSLRSAAGGADVNKLAKRFGGGGHEHAAGFTARTLEEALAGKTLPVVHPPGT